MTSYFDSRDRQVSEATATEEVMLIEAGVIEDMRVILSHKELPKENRKEIEAIVREVRLVSDEGNGESLSTRTATNKGREWWDMMRSSLLLTNLHTAFHTLASLNITASDGVRFSDKPDSIVKSMKRDE